VSRGSSGSTACVPRRSTPPTRAARSRRMKHGSLISVNGQTFTGRGLRDRPHTATRSSAFRGTVPAWKGWSAWSH